VKKKINIAIDGYSSCGKSTVARSVARELNYIYVDSGAMYRALTLYALQQGFICQDGTLDEEGLERSLELVLVNFRFNSETGQNEIFLNGHNVDREIRSLQVSNYVSKVSDVKAVRHKLVKLQRRIAESKGVVMDGRDIGTVVIPDAEMKFFMTADSKVRAKRRFEELRSMGVDTTLEEVLKNVNSRDEYDSNRANDPLRCAADAIVIDNTGLTLEEQFQFVIGHVVKRIGAIESVW
jgi:CMP/dCMP kinase